MKKYAGTFGRGGVSVIVAAAILWLLLMGRSAAQQLALDQPLVWVGDQPPAAAETVELWWAVAQFHTNQPAGLAALEQFLINYPSSPWVPSLETSLAFHYRGMGRDTLALERWQAAWSATQFASSGAAKEVADFTLAHWTRLLASLGRYETLSAILQQTRGRVLDHGPLSQRWARTGEAVAQMGRLPGISYRCGTFALYEVARELRLKYDVGALVRVPSPTNGFSLRVLADLSTQLGLGLVPVHRDTGQEVAVPSLVHWSQNHYAAIVGREGPFFRVVDPTFGRPRWLTADTLNAEASGYFMVRGNVIPTGYRAVGPDEAGQVFGRGNPNFFGDGDDQPCSCEDGECPPGSDGPEGTPGGVGEAGPGGAGPGCGSCWAGSSGAGMPVWRISEPYVNEWLCASDQILREN